MQIEQAVHNQVFPEIKLKFVAAQGFRSRDGKFNDKLRQHARGIYKVARGRQWTSCVDRYNRDPAYRGNIALQGLDISFCQQVDDFQKSQSERIASGAPIVLSSPVPYDERVARFGHYRTTLPAPDAAGNTVPRSSVEGYIPYEHEVEEWRAHG